MDHFSNGPAAAAKGPSLRADLHVLQQAASLDSGLERVPSLRLEVAVNDILLLEPCLLRETIPAYFERPWHRSMVPKTNCPPSSYESPYSVAPVLGPKIRKVSKRIDKITRLAFFSASAVLLSSFRSCFFLSSSQQEHVTIEITRITKAAAVANTVNSANNSFPTP